MGRPPLSRRMPHFRRSMGTRAGMSAVAAVGAVYRSAGEYHLRKAEQKWC